MGSKAVAVCCRERNAARTSGRQTTRWPRSRPAGPSRSSSTRRSTGRTPPPTSTRRSPVTRPLACTAGGNWPIQRTQILGMCVCMYSTCVCERLYSESHLFDELPVDEVGDERRVVATRICAPVARRMRSVYQKRFFWFLILWLQTIGVVRLTLATPLRRNRRGGRRIRRLSLLSGRSRWQRRRKRHRRRIDRCE